MRGVGAVPGRQAGTARARPCSSPPCLPPSPLTSSRPYTSTKWALAGGRPSLRAKAVNTSGLASRGTQCCCFLEGEGEGRPGAGPGAAASSADMMACVGGWEAEGRARGAGAREKKKTMAHGEREGACSSLRPPLSLGGAALLTPPADRRGARHQLLARVPHAHPTPCASQRQASPPSPSSGGGRPPRAPAGAPSTFRDVRARLFFFPRSGAAPRSIPLRCVKPARAGMCGRRCRPPPPMAGEAAHTPTRPSPAAAEK